MLEIRAAQKRDANPQKEGRGGNGSRSSTSPASFLLNGRGNQAIARAGFLELRLEQTALAGGLPGSAGSSADAPPTCWVPCAVRTQRPQGQPCPEDPPVTCHTSPTPRRAGSTNGHTRIVPVHAPAWVGVPRLSAQRRLAPSCVHGGTVLPWGQFSSLPSFWFQSPAVVGTPHLGTA